ncbi:hypothetical protein BDZ91DRAFT_756177 [Kalaharituber pfeilii]|nr:hypothetical protein BDZ91DRAFT_756177 [Kalaharituber pfeilii]
MKVPKHPIAVLNKIGLSVSYPTIVNAIKANETAVIDEIRSRIRGGEAFAIMYDNLVQKGHVGEQSLTNRTVLYKHTVVAASILHLPEIIKNDIDLQNVDWVNVDPMMVIGYRDIVELWPQFVAGYITQSLQGVAEENMARNELKLKPMEVPEIYQMDHLRSEIYVLSTQDQEEGTIEGNIAQLRVRDLIHRRLKYISQWNSELHIIMCLQQLIMGINMGEKGGHELASLARMILVLGREKLGGEKPEFHAYHRFLMLVLNTLLLVAVMTKLNAKTIDIFAMRKMSLLRKRAKEYGRSEYAQQATEIKLLPKGLRTPEQERFLKQRAKKIEEFGDKKRDIVYENIMLLLQHLIIYKWQYTSMKNGDTGALEHYKDFLCVLFHGGSNHNYAQELLKQAIDHKCVWTSWYRQM